MKPSDRVPQFGPLFYSVLVVAVWIVFAVRVVPFLTREIVRVWLVLLVDSVPVHPELVVWLVGVLVVVTRWRRHPQVSLCALLGIGGLLVLWLARFVLDVRIVTREGAIGQWFFSTTGTFHLWRGVIDRGLTVTCWVLLIIAILGWRDGRAKSDPAPLPREENDH